MNLENDLSKYHYLIGELFDWPQQSSEWEKFTLNEDQVAFFNENGYLPNIKILEAWQVDQLNEELKIIMDPDHPSQSLFYEFHSNESSDTDTVLFHLSKQPASCLEGKLYVSGTTSFSANRQDMEVW
jgi:hypothetical protein